MDVNSDGAMPMIALRPGEHSERVGVRSLAVDRPTPGVLTPMQSRIVVSRRTPDSFSERMRLEERGVVKSTLKVWRDDKLVLQIPLQAVESVAKGNISQRAIDAVSEMVIALFRAGAERL